MSVGSIGDPLPVVEFLIVDGLPIGKSVSTPPGFAVVGEESISTRGPGDQDPSDNCDESTESVSEGNGDGMGVVPVL